MLVLPIHRILITIVVFLALYAKAEDISDTSTLFNLVPDCAKDCVIDFIKSEYTPTECISPSNVTCFCRTKTANGFTLGEAALSCVLSMCEKDVAADLKAYHICDSVSGSIPKTHKTITATVFSDTSTTIAGDATTTVNTVATSSTETSKSTSKALLTTSSITPAPTSTSTSTASSRTSEVTSYDASSSSSQVTSTSSTQGVLPSGASYGDTSNNGNSSTSPGTVIGVSVASGIAGSFVIGVAVVFFCKRRRNQHRGRPQSDPYIFEIGGAMSEPPDFAKTMPHTPSLEPNLGIFHDPTTDGTRSPPGAFRIMYSPQFATASHAPSDQTRESRDQGRIGFAVTSDSDWSSPYTQSSQNSGTRLLRNSPEQMFPKPLKWSHRPPSGETLFEEDETQQIPAMTCTNSRAGVAGLPANPRAFKGTPKNPNQASGPRSLASPFNPASYDAPEPTIRVSSSIPKNTERVTSRPHDNSQYDIEHVQMWNGPRPHKELVAPYYPEGPWGDREQHSKPYQVSNQPPCPSDTYPSSVVYPAGPPKRVEYRVSPTSRNLTPSKLGDDLILRVD
ncbi:uncharacterized protein N7529_005521 [Penicillium soppii]|jgi:hypothetical protein|uniref:uncharacterized protein n=1 Tax=Penicillium soppii TaxID=69789 RepID=UPI002546CC36|nr:uncharacterized protein N7529_005521 [Penicillium soppii]KAJ5863605.1 hypothetical protein N7529_005521 [Penicillium soppii]